MGALTVTQWGASKEDWIHFDLVLGLTEDLLPVVSDPTAEISPHSDMKAIGKTPSEFNKNGKVVGIPKWTEKRADGDDIKKWSSDNRLGICIQTRQVRALDIDVDHAQAVEIAKAFVAQGLHLPVRERSNSGKMLLAFVLEGEFPKRSFKTAHGLVEFLGNGQQMVVSGTHPSGVRYRWRPEQPEFPTVTAEQFEAAWSAIVDRFALPDTAYEAGTRKRGEDFHATDTTAEHLVDAGLVLGEGRDGQLYISCPWKDGHSSDSGVTEAAWFPAGSNGYEQGHYKCLHASCAKRTDDEFREAVGCGTSSDFATLPDVPSDSPVEIEVEPPPFSRDSKGFILAIVNNVMSALESPEWFGASIAYDEFRDEVLFSPFGTEQWRPIQDTDLTLMRRRLDQRGFKPAGPELIWSVVHAVASSSGGRSPTTSEW